MNRYDKYYSGLNKLELEKQIKKLEKIIRSYDIKISRASESTANLPARKGIRGGKNTTLQARLQQYLDLREDFKEMLNIAKKYK